MDFLTNIVSALLATGPVGLIAALELLAIMALGYGNWYFLKQRSGQAGLIKSNADKVEKLQTAHNAKLSEIHDSYQIQLAQLHEKRIADVKEITADFSELASRTAETINRLTLQLEIRGGRK